MNVSRVIRVKNDDPLAAVRAFLTAWWTQIELRAMLAPLELNDRSGIAVQPIDLPTRLAYVNPFAPIMTGNAAALVNAFAASYPGERLAALLRPCELCALIELRKRRRVPAVDDALKHQTLLLIGVDCVATYPAEAYARYVPEQGADVVTCDALMYAGENAYSPYELRPACKVCDRPVPRYADVVLGAIGVPVDQYLLVITQNESIDRRWRLSEITSGLATTDQVNRRETVIDELVEQRRVTRTQQLGDAAAHLLGFTQLLSWLSNCTLCGDCLDACPLYNGELAGLLGAGGSHRGNHAPLASLVDVARWLTSCTGCGMCEAACEKHIPLSQLASTLSQGIRSGLHHYAAGDPDQPLPWDR